MRYGVKAVWIAAMAGAAMLPEIAMAQVADGSKPGQGAPAQDAPPPVDAQDGDPIVTEQEFEAAIPELSDDINAPLEPMTAFENPGRKDDVAQNADAKDSDAQEAAADADISADEAAQLVSTDDIGVMPVDPEEEAAFEAPLTSLAEFDVTPVKIEGVEDEKQVEIAYSVVVEGLEKVGLEDEFRDLSALEEGDGDAANAAMVAARAREDEGLAVRLMHSLGYYDGTALATIEQNPANSGRLRVTLSADPGAIYRLGSITIDADETVPAGLIDEALPLNVGDPIDAVRIQAAEANVSLRLPQQGYPFAKVLERDVLLDPETHKGDYTLPVEIGSRVSYYRIETEPASPESELAFDAEHVRTLARFKQGDLYDSRKIDDLRDALIATGLFSTVSVEPLPTGEIAPDGTEYVRLLVRQDAGPPRTLAIEGGYSTGQGLRIEGSWTHRNLFPPEGALIVSGVGGTQEQGLGVTFRRQNAGRRDRTVSLTASVNHSDYDAFESFTGTLAGRISFDSTPIWQKRWTYYYGFEIVGTNEDRYNFDLGERDRGTWLIGALPSFIGFDTSDDLLNPTRGFRIKLNVSPETSVRGAARPYGRFMLEGTAYYPVSDGLVIAGRARAGTIPGIARNDLPPSRRYYAGGGGSVRGFGYQELGPRAPDGRPIGGRSLNEFAIEARYRFGNFGIVPFVDAGQVYESIYPQLSDMRFGVGIGGRFYTNFGPLRLDVATPLGRRDGESRVSVYISIGQAF